MTEYYFQADQPLPPLIVQIRAYVAGNYCGLLLTPGSQYVISGRIPVLRFLLHVIISNEKKYRKLTRFKINFIPAELLFKCNFND